MHHIARTGRDLGVSVAKISPQNSTARDWSLNGAENEGSKPLSVSVVPTRPDFDGRDLIVGTIISIVVVRGGLKILQDVNVNS